MLHTWTGISIPLWWMLPSLSTRSTSRWSFDDYSAGVSSWCPSRKWWWNHLYARKERKRRSCTLLSAMCWKCTDFYSKFASWRFASEKGSEVHLTNGGDVQDVAYHKTQHCTRCDSRCTVLSWEKCAVPWLCSCLLHQLSNWQVCDFLHLSFYLLNNAIISKKSTSTVWFKTISRYLSTVHPKIPECSEPDEYLPSPVFHALECSGSDQLCEASSTTSGALGALQVTGDGDSWMSWCSCEWLHGIFAKKRTYRIILQVFIHLFHLVSIYLLE